MMVGIYWIFDAISAGPYLPRTSIALMLLVYGVFTQGLINARKTALAEKEKAQQRLLQAERLAALGSVAAGVAHEVKNPLAIILQGMAFLKSALQDDARLLDVVRRVEKSVLRADNIIQGLLSYSREIPLKREEADLVPVVEEALSFVDHRLRMKSIQVKRQYAPLLPKVILDTNQIKQALTNLFTNAIEAMPESGILGVRIAPGEGETEPASVRVAVTDTGEGIPEESIRKIFDPFFTTKNIAGNTGLGLSITKGIIDKHHGTIAIDSEPGRGTRVTIQLPVGLE